MEEAGLGDEVEVCGTGCLGLCHAGPLVQVESRDGEGHVCRCLYERVDAARRRPRWSASTWPAAAPLARTGGSPLDDPVLHQPAARWCSQGSGAARPGADRELPRRRRLPGAPAGPHRADARRGRRRDHRERPARPRRRRLPHRPQVGHRGQRRRAPGRCVVCNADEGDPGAFMDRCVLEGDPHRVLEGMAIAGYAVGAEQGYVYVRGEYPLAIERLRDRHQAGRAARLLGTPHLRHRLQLPHRAAHRRRRLRLRRGDGAASPRSRASAARRGPGPPYPAERGLWGQPTPHQQRGDLRQRAGDHPRTAATGSPPSAPSSSQGHQGVRAGRADRQHRPGRGADGHHPAPDRLGDRRRHPRRPGVQGGADRRALGRLHPGRAPRPPGRLRVACWSWARSWARAA